MTLFILDDVIEGVKDYVKDIHAAPFVDMQDGDKTFKGIQPRPHDDEFAQSVLEFVGPSYEIAYNFIRRSPKGQKEPNYIHTDEMMGDLTAILYLSEAPPEEDGTTIYDDEEKKVCVIYSKFNRMVIFPSSVKHSRNIMENFGVGRGARLIQVIFLKQVK